MKMRAEVIGSLPACINGDEGGSGGLIAGATAVVSTVSKWVADHGSEIQHWVSENLAPALRWVQSFAQTLGIGPGYRPEDGGEVHRQLESLGWLSLPWANPYLNWLKTYNPHDVWNTGDIWDFPDTHPSTWAETYMRYVDAGLPAGALLDANMVPVGLAASAAAVEQADAYLAAHPLPSGGGWQTPRAGGGSGGGYQQSSGGPPAPPPSPGASNNLLLYGGLALLGVILLPRITR